MNTYAITFKTREYDAEVELIKAQSVKQARRLFVDQFGDRYDGVTITMVEPYETHDEINRRPGSAGWCETNGDNH